MQAFVIDLYKNRVFHCIKSNDEHDSVTIGCVSLSLIDSYCILVINIMTVVQSKYHMVIEPQQLQSILSACDCIGT